MTTTSPLLRVDHGVELDSALRAIVHVHAGKQGVGAAVEELKADVYRLDHSICRHFAPDTGRVDAHICFSDLSSSFSPCVYLRIDPSSCCFVDVLLGNRFFIGRNRFGF
jgi:hypothetical protein